MKRHKSHKNKSGIYRELPQRTARFGSMLHPEIPFGPNLPETLPSESRDRRSEPGNIQSALSIPRSLSPPSGPFRPAPGSLLLRPGVRRKRTGQGAVMAAPDF